MKPFDPHTLSRRTFLGHCCAAVSATGMLSALAQLRLVGAVASPVPGDFKALVCLFMSGGNDANNLIIPNDTDGYATYADARGVLALPQTGLLGISPATSDGRAWALHPSLAELQALFAGGKVALLANVGTLVVPTTKAQYKAKSVPLPQQLFSHYDQQVEWMTSLSEKGQASTGWGGRLADLTQAFNSNNSISMSISLDGLNTFQIGKSVSQYVVSPSGAVTMSGLNTTPGSLNYQRTIAQQDLMSGAYPNLLDAAFAGTTSKAMADSVTMAGLLKNPVPFSTVFPTSSLGKQLSLIARLIGLQSSMGLNRQIFFARVSGWDLHDNQLDAHAALLTDLSQSMNAFYQATVEMGVDRSVTTFTASDFGRTFTTNGDGSDHGWGSHHLVMGGAVKGGDLYGRMPDLTVGGPDDTGRGRWIPTTSVDEYNATLARWFGVSDSDLEVVLPNLARFAHRDLGFLV